jgi:UDP-N-acetylmuramate dehydrogenase
LLAVAEDTRGLQYILRSISDAGIRWFVLGAGTNVVFGDEGFDGVVVKLGPAFSRIEKEGTGILAGASGLLSDAVSFCAEHSLSGLEKLAGIPGSIGGAVAGNAGAFGTTIGERVDCLRGFGAGGTARSLGPTDVDFGYRHADFGSWMLLTEVVLSLGKGQKEAIRAEMDGILETRKERQPYEFPCAGSVFKNPPGTKAASLIEEAGLKGRRVGGAEVSNKHANFIVNRGGASSSDVLSLIDVVRKEVLRRFSVPLQLEIRVVQ